MRDSLQLWFLKVTFYWLEEFLISGCLFCVELYLWRVHIRFSRTFINLLKLLGLSQVPTHDLSIRYMWTLISSK
jgi:hypothetical protein